jgi:hypothetical protein
MKLFCSFFLIFCGYFGGQNASHMINEIKKSVVFQRLSAIMAKSHYRGQTIPSR